MPPTRRHACAGLPCRWSASGSSARIFWPSSTGWRWTWSPTSARPILRRSISTATASPAPWGGFRCACSAWRRGRAWRSPIISDARCSSPISCATSTRMPAWAGSICRARRSPRPASPPPSRQPCSPIRRWRAACAPIIERARAHFRQADAIMARAPRRSVRAPRIMAEAYRLILDGLVARGFNAPRRARPHPARASPLDHSALRISLMADRPYHRRGACRPLRRGPARGSGRRGRRARGDRPGRRARRSYHDHFLGAVIDNGNHLLLSGNHAAMSYLRLIGAEDALTGPASAEIPFIDLATQRALGPAPEPRPAAVVDFQPRPTRAGNVGARLSRHRAAPAGARIDTDRRGHAVLGQALSTPVASAVSCRAQYRTDGGRRRPCRRRGARDAAAGRPRQPAAHCARGAVGCAHRSGVALSRKPQRARCCSSTICAGSSSAAAGWRR